MVAAVAGDVRQASAGPAIFQAAMPVVVDRPAAGRPVANGNVALPPLTENGPAGPSRSDVVAGDSPVFTIIDDGLAERTEDLAVDELGEVARVQFVAFAANDLQRVVPGGEAGSFARELVGALINRARSERPAGTGPDSAGQSAEQSAASGGGRGIIDEVLSSGLTDIIVDTLQPRTTAEGFVEFSIAGLGSFALVLTDATGDLFLVDLERGSAIKVYRSTQQDPQRALSSQQPTTQRTATGGSNAVVRFVDFLNTNIVPVVTSPITLAAVGIFGLLWVLWRVSMSER